ncbi:hypothetical protein AMS68_006818 [Peltaster fructicola]|uniref:FCP1 homology domain-containing protein n=1 Tax=Peltaster fructicola TaxID=286661 RepID=A0A6H0Y313_9PEZI|nr:hypothetical protein AMS68_006818 [Peltaster fructicola]
MASQGLTPNDVSGAERTVVPPPRSSSREPARVNDPAQLSLTSDAAARSASVDHDTAANGPQDLNNEKDAFCSSSHRCNGHWRTSTAKPKKKGGFLSFLNCCSRPDVDEIDSPDSAQPSKTPVNRAQPTRSRIPQDQQPQNNSVTDTSGDSKDVIDEKAAYEGTSKATADESAMVLPAEPASASNSAPETSERQTGQLSPGVSPIGPQVSVQAPTPILPQSEEEQLISDRTPEQAQRDTDIEMTDAGPSIPLSTAEVPAVPEAESNEAQPRKSQDSLHRVDLPPPPPLAERQAQTSNAVAVAQGQDPSVAFSPEPARKWLLPSIKTDMRGRKCLVLDLDETLVHSSFKILHQADFTIPVEIEGQYHNVYVIKRPGVDEFLRRVGEIYEVVVFTASVSKYGDPLLDQLDISGSVHHRLFRESCYNHQGNYVKDLSQVGRPLEETIIIDNSPTSYIFHPQHAVPISSWFSDAHDNELLDLIPVLEDLAGDQVRDVSLVLDVAL